MRTMSSNALLCRACHLSLSSIMLIIMTFVPAASQDRDVRGERLVIDDNNGNTIVIKTPTGPITGGTLTIPDPAGTGEVLISNPVGGSQAVSGDLLPGADNAYDLGVMATRWRDIFLSGNVTANGDVLASGDVTAGGDVTVGGEVRLVETGGGADYVGFRAPALVTTSQTWTLPAADGTSGQVLSTNGAGTLSWASGGGLTTVTHNATLTGNGTVGSPLAINLANANTWTANQTFASAFLITSNARIAMTNSDNNARDLRMQEPSGTGTQYVGIRAPSVVNNGNYLLPSVVGTAGQVLTIQTSNNGAGTMLMDSATLTWTTPSGGGTVTGDSTLIGDGTVGTPLGLDLAQSNVWTATISTFAVFLESRNEPFVVTNTDNSANEIRIQEASDNGSNYVAFRADTSITTNDVWIMPSTAGTAGQVLGITAVNTPSNRFYTLDWVDQQSTLTRGSVSVTSGAQGTITATGVSYIRFTGASGAFTVDGFTGGTDGKLLVLYNSTTQNMTLKFNTAATASNGINTMNGIDASTVGEGAAYLIYDGTSSRWLVLTVRG